MWQYIKRCYKCSDENCCRNVSFEELNYEVQNVYPDGLWGMYHVNDKTSFIDIIDNPREDMKKVFLDIHGGEPLLLTISEFKRKK